jgi:hypothetical protein
MAPMHLKQGAHLTNEKKYEAFHSHGWFIRENMGDLLGFHGKPMVI